MVLLDWNELQGEKDFKEEIHRAFGVDGLGILCVKNVPGLAEARYIQHILLTYSIKLIDLLLYFLG